MTKDANWSADRERVQSRRVDPELPPRRGRRADPTVLVLIAFGGVAGTAVRYGIGRIAPPVAGAFPWSTFVINVTGSFVLGGFLAWLSVRRPDDRHLRPLVAIGFLGGYTTFSTAMVESALLVKDGPAAIAFGYLAVGLVTAVVAVAAGVTTTRRVLAC